MSRVRSLLFLSLLIGCDTAAVPAPPKSPEPGVATGSQPGDGRFEEPKDVTRFAAAEASGAAAALVSAPDDAGGLRLPSGGSLDGAMLIRTGRIDLEVDSLDAAIARLRALAARLGGFIGNAGIQGGANAYRSATLEVRLPADRFDEAFGGLAAVGRLKASHVSVQDIGEEFVDVNARMTNARELESRLLDLLARRTGKLEEMLRVERELARVREEVERYQGRLRYLSQQVAWSSISATLAEPGPIVGPPGNHPITASLVQAWRNAVQVTAAGIAGLGLVLPPALLGWLGWLGLRRWRLRPRLGAG